MCVCDVCVCVCVFVSVCVFVFPEPSHAVCLSCDVLGLMRRQMACSPGCSGSEMPTQDVGGHKAVCFDSFLCLKMVNK